jgi:hypothetical protein
VTGCRRAHCQTPANPAAAAAAAAAIHPQLGRLRRICERRLCETVDVETVATTLALAEQNHAEELKRVCLDFVSRNLAQVRGGGGGRGAGAQPRAPTVLTAAAALKERPCACASAAGLRAHAAPPAPRAPPWPQVMGTDGYRHMTRSCPSLQAELLSVIASNGTAGGGESRQLVMHAAAGGGGHGHGGGLGGGGGGLPRGVARLREAVHDAFAEDRRVRARRD